MTQHEWFETTETGERRYYRATHHASRWRFETTLAKEEFWHDVEIPDREYLEGLQKVIFNKYQRRRVPHKILAEIDEMLEERIEAEELAAAEGSPGTSES